MANFRTLLRPRRLVICGLCCFIIVFLFIFELQLFSHKSDGGVASVTLRRIDGNSSTKPVNQTSVCDKYKPESALPHGMSLIPTRLKRNSNSAANKVDAVSRLWNSVSHIIQKQPDANSDTTNSRGECTATKIDPEPPCRDDCQNMRDLLNAWPNGKPKAAIYFLAQMKRLEMLKKMLCTLDVHFNDQFSYPVIIFSEEPLLQNDCVKKDIRAATNSRLFFQTVPFEIPSHINRKDVLSHTPCSSDQPIGYRHMCRFHAKAVYDQPIMNGLDYAWRLDDDAIITSAITYDIFVKMAKNNYTYGYRTSNWDESKCIIGLWEAACKYMRDIEIETTSFNTWSHGMMYYNNFEVSKLSFWRSCDYQLYIDYIDRLGGIYFYRWGDAPIKSIGVSLFVEKENVYKFTDIGYEHKPNAKRLEAIVCNYNSTKG